MYRQRLRSPLRWLSATMSALMLIGLSAIAGPWLLAVAPLVAAVFLLAPPLGIYRHDETPVPLASVRVVFRPDADGQPPNALRLILSARNDSQVAAHDFRLRVVVPEAVVPADLSGHILGPLLAGAAGRHWVTESTATGASITFRAGRPGEPDAIALLPGAELPLAAVNLPAGTDLARLALECQVSGGNVRARLERVTPAS